MSETVTFRVGRWTATPRLNLLERDGRSVRLEPRAMDVLAALADRPGAVVSIDELIGAVWKDVAVTDGSVYLAVSQLRQALGDDDAGVRYIETIPKRGYRLAVPVVRDPTPAASRETPVVVADAPAPSPVPASRRRFWAPVAATVMAAGCLAAVTLREDVRSSSTPSVAVLPFDNASSDPEQDYFAHGITVEILNALARVPELRVIGSTSSFLAGPRARDPQAAAAALGVAHVVQGSVRTDGNRLRVAVHLSRALTGDRVWAGTYERRRADIFQVQDEIATAVATALQVRLGIGDIGRVPGMTRDVDAYEAYLRARTHNLAWTPASFHLAIAQLQRAVAIDPSFSVAWARLSTVYLNGATAMPERSAEWRARAAEALAQAQALTPDAPDVLLEIGVAEARRQNWLAAARAFERLQPSYARHGLPDSAWGPRGIVLLAVGRPHEAVTALERARALEPLAPAFATFLAAGYVAGGNTAGALAEIDRGLTLGGLEPVLREDGLLVALNARDPVEIAARARALPDTPAARLHHRLARFVEDVPAGAKEAERIAASASAPDKASLAAWAAFYGRPALALRLLTDAAPHLGHPARIWQPLFRDVRAQPGFRDVARTLGLVAHWRAYGWPPSCRPTGADDFECR